MATPVFCCGFECGVSGAHWTLDAAASFSTSTTRSAARALRVNAAAAVSQVLGPTLSSSAFFVARFYIRFATLPNVNCVLFGVTSTNEYGLVFKQSDSKLYAGRGAAATVTFGATGATVTTGVWYRIDLKIDVSNNPRLVDVSVDGVALGQFSVGVASGTYTVPFAGATNNAAPTADVFFDDVIVSQTLADYPLGPGKVDTFTTTGDGAHNIAGGGDFQRGNTAVDILNATTTAWQLVDDVPLPSGAVAEADCWRGVAPANAATDYVEGLFGPAPGISTPTVAPRAVEVILAHHQIATTVGQMVVRLNDNGTTDNVFDTGAAAGVTTYRYARKHYAAGPAGAWVIGGGGGGDFTDLRVRFLAPDANPDQCLDAIMIEAEFQEIAVIPNKIYQVNQAVNRAANY